MTTKLIQELCGLCDSKNIHNQVYNRLFLISKYEIGLKIIIDLEEDGAPEQLQAAIDKVKSL